MGRRNDRTPPHAPVPTTITVTVPVGLTWDGRITERRHMSLFQQALQLPYQLDGHGAAFCSSNHYSYRTSWMDMGRRNDRTPSHTPVPATITVAVPVGYTWGRNQRYYCRNVSGLRCEDEVTPLLLSDLRQAAVA
ncbi:hypothetical protein AVEN_133005-1 [Araneus ventricosus]|uniref:Uncharacterized protein n=1 Tax=Araneus ventricosus TaxID=182803 RepID=A0A4Y2IKT3_ARAVE|nr:hypothetical protein AVEN_133005-1 [Araneus ventricosus]